MEIAIQTATTERPDFAKEAANAALEAGDYPLVMQFAADALGMSRLREQLRAALRPRGEYGAIYRVVARWPVPVHLTTNFDESG